MAKVGIRTASLNQSLPETLETAGRLGYDGVEAVTRDPEQLRGWLSQDGPSGAAAQRAQAQKAGVEISSFSLAIYRPVNFAQEDEAKRREGVALVSDTLRACKNVGGVAVLLPHFDRERLDVSADEERRFVDGLRQVAPVAEETGVAIAIETSFSAAQLIRIVDAVGSSKVGVYQDLANAIIYQQDPAATLRALGKRIVMLHVKDTAPGGGNCALGEGRVDWKDCLAAVRDVGYDTPDAWFVLETPAGDNPARDAARYLEFTRTWLAS
ncbi:MAG TPA: sugar phosphate isomerase/epimerase family protein [Chloroflexota bacterium]|nr:sugar phosphate isomerase/epimerase family protein [Chloroflexota bacterium]